MLRGVFVTGTDTGAGKTVVSAALMSRYRPIARGLRYWKPVQTGSEQDDDSAEVGRLASCSDTELFSEGVRFPQPLSPHLAAQLNRTRICVVDLVRRVACEPDGPPWIVEGAGGVLVPLNESELMVDLMASLSLPVVVVSRSTLGTINHTLLTLESLRRRAVDVAGVVMVGDRNAENRQAIEQYGAISVLGEMPHFTDLTPDTIGRWAALELDPAKRLDSLFV